MPQQGPRLPVASQQLDLKISGFDVGALLSQLRQWVSPSNEASVTVEARGTGSTVGLVEAVVSWPGAPEAASNTARSASVFFGGGPQDRKPIATISKLIELQPGGPAVALARLETGATAGNGALKRIADEPNLGEELKVIGQPKSGKVRTLRLETQDFGKGLIAVVPKVTGPGDAGAPFVDAKGQLQAMGYAGSDESSLLIPLPDLLNRDKLSLD